MPQPARVSQPRQHEHPGALGKRGPIGGTRIGLTTTIGGQRPLPAELDEHRRGGHHGDPTDQRQVAFAEAQ
ncbi:hypothetical protein Z028_08875 [Mycobacterium tuberculosis INS_MDR]|nr:hypothetical protein Z030_08865 [Mycobacterium tuberculosis INS_XDR]EUB00746.1 hypothetical protein Z028_08875 [Mycobacterium tuberculosis INS_MDR]